jgi:anti-sigma factor RsiW
MADQYIEQIIRYLEGALKPEERKNFEAQLRTDNKLKGEFNLLKEMVAAIKSKRKAAMKTDLKAVWKKIKKEAPPVQTDEEGNIPEARKVDIDRLKNFALKTAAGLAAAGFLFGQLGGAMGAKTQDKKGKKKKKRGK